MHAQDEIDLLRTKPDCCLVIDGESLQVCISKTRYLYVKIPIKSFKFEFLQKKSLLMTIKCWYWFSVYETLKTCLDHLKEDFIAVAVRLSAVVCCRCSPTQKADITRLIKSFTNKRVCAIGDGGNDVSMIQAADVGM